MGKSRTSYKKGQTGNPKGRPPLPDEVKQARKINQAVFQDILSKYSNSSYEDLILLSNDKSVPAIELIVIRSLVWSLSKKDNTGSREFIIERMCGKVAQSMNLNANVSNHKSLIDELTEDD